MRHPMQPLYVGKNKEARFKENKIVRYILDNGGIDLNQIAMMPFPQEDRVQFAQLIGYSLIGFHELSYVPDEDALVASKEAQKINPKFQGCRDVGCSIHCGVEREDV